MPFAILRVCAISRFLAHKSSAPEVVSGCDIGIQIGDCAPHGCHGLASSSLSDRSGHWISMSEHVSICALESRVIFIITANGIERASLTPIILRAVA